MIPYDYYNYRNISCGNHSVIYSKKMREQLLKVNQKDISDWDYYNNIYFVKNRYCYYKPLCYQLFTNTVNSSQWGINTIFKNIVKYCNFLIHIFKQFNMDKNPEPGFSYFYIFGKINFILIILLIIILISY